MNMKIITGHEFESFIERCGFRLDQYIKQLSAKRYPPNSGSHMLILTPQNGETWLLVQEIETSESWSKREKLFEFEGLGPYNNEHKIYIPSKEFIELLQDFFSKSKQFHISMLADTVGLKNNAIIKRNFEEYQKSNNEKLGLDKMKPKEYYDKEFGSKSEKELELHKKARQSIDNLGTNHGSFHAMKFYSQIIELNPKNAFALFNKGLAILDYWRFERTRYMLFDKSSDEEKQKEIKIKEAERRQEAEKCFKKAIELHPYLIETYQKLEREKRIY